MFGCQISFAYKILLNVKVNLHYSTSAVLYPYIKLILLNYTSYMWCLNKNSKNFILTGP